MKDIYQTICKNLKELRISAGYIQAEVAEFLGVSRTNYGRYENGTRNIPIDLLVKLADFYQISLDEIIGRE